MKFKILNSIDRKFDISIIPCFLNEKYEKYEDILIKLEDKNIFSGKKYTSYSFTQYMENDISNIIFLGLGDRKNLTYEILYKSIVECFKSIKFNRDMDILLDLFNSENLEVRDIMKAFVLGIEACEYSFSKYLTEKKSFYSVNIYLNSETIDLNNTFLSEALNIMEAKRLSRDLINEPANILTPNEFAIRCKEAVKDLNLEINIYDEKWIKENNLSALYEVGKASVNKPRFVVIKYFGNKENDKFISFVGKGLTYDSGGYSIKSSDGMVTMKCDMSGAASVLSLMALIAKQNLKINVYGVLPICENMINGNGFKPGDIINSLAGKTIEIISTDAEGRLALADGVNYAANVLNSDIIVDIATLTGACGIALGTKYAAIIDNDEKIFEKLRESSENTSDFIWRLPNDEEYKELLKSDVADYKNIGGRYGGTITAGLFVGEFVNNKPWAHIDIAYVAWNDFSTKVFPKKGATGAGVE